MALYARWSALCDELDKASGELAAFASLKSTLASAGDFAYREECFLEGALSRSWQAWGSFWRECIVESCMGTIDGAGQAVSSHHLAATPEDVSGAVVKAKDQSAKPPYWGGKNSVLRYEPTWGDTDVLNRIIPRLGSANQSQLLAAASQGHQYAKVLQFVRNAAAHQNAQTMAEVLGLRSAYIVFPITHPVHALFWIEPSSRDFLWRWALEGLRDAGLSAIS